MAPSDSATAPDAARPDAAPGLPDFADGTRLKALAYVMDDGQQLWHGWRDSARDESCSFQLAADGQLRCLPAFEASPVVFADDRCTERVLVNSPCVDGPAIPPPYAVVGGTCGGNTGTLYKRLDKLGSAGSVPVYAPDSSGNCVQTGGAANDEFWALAATPEPTDAFVSAREILEDRGPGLAARYYQAEDGALQLVGAYDRATERPCAESPLMPGVCAPDPLIIAYDHGYADYTDAACTVATVNANRQCGVPAQPADVVFVHGGVPAPAACETGPAGRFFRLGAPFPDRPFEKSGDRCAQTTSTEVGTPSQYRFVLAEEVPSSAFPAVRTTDVGSSRLRVRTEETLDGRHLARKAIFDTGQGTTCTPTAVEGTLHCLPDVALFFASFADSSCSQPLLQSFEYPHATGDNLCGLKFVKWQENYFCGQEPPALRYFEIGPVVTPPTPLVFAKGTDGGCGAGSSGLDSDRQLIEHPLTDAPAIGGE